jgi:hypothetical protein
VDDDNWVASDWLATAYDVLSTDPRLGAVGSICGPVCEVPEPEWFQKFQMSYAILTDRDFHEMQQPPEFLNGAGLCVRRVAWERLVENGFRFQLTGRVGKGLSAGEDTELTSALRLAGWKLRVEQRLRLLHFMPVHRLTWNYLRRLYRGYSASQVPLDAYSVRNLSSQTGLKPWLRERWWYQLRQPLGQLACRPGAVLAAFTSDSQGQYDVIEVEKMFGRIIGLFRLRGGYTVLRREVRNAHWRKGSDVFAPDLVAKASSL